MSTQSPEFDRQLEAQEEQQKRDIAHQQAAQAGMDQAQVNKSPTFLREYGDPDISPRQGASSTEQELAAELSHHHLFGNITREEFRRRQIQNRVSAMRKKAEHPKRAGATSKCTGTYRQRVFDDDAEVRTPEMEREIDSILGPGGVREQMQSQSIQASAWKGITQMKSVIQTAGSSAKDATAGALGRAKEFLFGGDS